MSVGVSTADGREVLSGARGEGARPGALQDTGPGMQGAGPTCRPNGRQINS